MFHIGFLSTHMKKNRVRVLFLECRNLLIGKREIHNIKSLAPKLRDFLYSACDNSNQE